MYFSFHCQISASERFSINYLHHHSSWNLVRANIFQRIISNSITAFLALWNKFSLTAFYWHWVILFNMCFRLSTGSWAAYGIWHIHIIQPTTEHPCNNKMLYMNMKFKKKREENWGCYKVWYKNVRLGLKWYNRLGSISLAWWFKCTVRGPSNQEH